jgi:transposase-like protein
MAERGTKVDHATIHRWIIRYSPELLNRFNSRKRAVTAKWHLDETYIKVRGQWKYLYRAIDSNGDTVEFWFSERRNLTAVKQFLSKALKRHGRPERVVIDGSQTNREANLSCDTTNRLQDRSRCKLRPIRIRRRASLNNRIEQDHRAIKRRVRPMLGFQPMATARVILGGTEMIHISVSSRQSMPAIGSRHSLSSFTCSLHERCTNYLLFLVPLPDLRRNHLSAYWG